MIKVFNKLIPFDGYLAITIWPFCFIRSDAKKPFNEIDENHEEIHGRQQVEFLIASAVIMCAVILVSGISWWWMFLSPVLYFVWYVLEYFIRCLIYEDSSEGYRNISFEQEAYMNEADLQYLSHRKPFSWIKYLGSKTYFKKNARDRYYNGDNF